MIIISICITLLVDLLHYRSIITLPVDLLHYRSIYYITGRLLHYRSTITLPVDLLHYRSIYYITGRLLHYRSIYYITGRFITLPVDYYISSRFITLPVDYYISSCNNRSYLFSLLAISIVPCPLTVAIYSVSDALLLNTFLHRIMAQTTVDCPGGGQVNGLHVCKKT